MRKYEAPHNYPGKLIIVEGTLDKSDLNGDGQLNVPDLDYILHNDWSK